LSALIEAVGFQRAALREITVTDDTYNVECNKSRPWTNKLVVAEARVAQRGNLSDGRWNRRSQLVAVNVKFNHLSQTSQCRWQSAMQLLAAQVGVPQICQTAQFRRDRARDASAHDIKNIQVGQLSDLSRQTWIDQIGRINVKLLNVATVAHQSRPKCAWQQVRTRFINPEHRAMALILATKRSIG
jgi:hypothetical protein